MLRGTTAACCALGLCLGLPARADSLRAAARVEVGAEHDTNTRRQEEVQGAPAPLVASPLGRFVASGDLALASEKGHSLALSGGLAGKAFSRAAAQSEDVLVAQASGAYRVRVARATQLGIFGAYYDVLQRSAGTVQDFRSVAPTLRLEQGVGALGALSLSAGYRWFTYKPEADFDFAAPTAALAYRQTLPAASAEGADWELAGAATVELRRFSGARCAPQACPAPPEAGGRRDQFWTVGLEATRTSSFLVGAGAALHGNASNSFGEPLWRGVFHTRAVVLLPWRLALSARAELVATRYLDAVPVGEVETGRPLASIEDESRSTLRIELARPLGAHLDLGVRYTHYSNEITAGPVRFRRQTVLGFLAISFER